MYKHAHTACKLTSAVFAVADLVQLFNMARPGKAVTQVKLSRCQKWVCANQEAEQGTVPERDREGQATVTRAIWEICMRRKEPHRGPGEHIPAEKTDVGQFRKQKVGLRKGSACWSLVQGLRLRAQSLHEGRWCAYPL